MARQNRFTIYDVMEQNGVFDKNPANPQARDSDGGSLYSGPVRFPSMLYSPSGERRIIERGKWEKQGDGTPVLVGYQDELVSQIVHSEAEEASLLAAGWHRNPARSLEAGGGPKAPVQPEELLSEQDKMIQELQKQLAETQQRLASAEMGAPSGGKASGGTRATVS